jgi:hypothetical protein
MVIAHRLFTFRFGSTVFSLPFSDDDTAERAIARIEELRGGTVLEMTTEEVFLFRTTTRIVKPSDRLSISRDGTFSIVLKLDDHSCDVTFANGRSVCFKIPGSATFRDLAKLVLPFVGEDAELSDILFCTQSGDCDPGALAENKKEVLYCTVAGEKMEAIVRLPDSNTIAIEVDQSAHVSDLKCKLLEKLSLPKLDIFLGENALNDDFRLCSVVFRRTPEVLEARSGLVVVRVKIGDLFFAFLFARRLTMADFRHWICERFTIADPKFKMTCDGVDQNDPTLILELDRALAARTFEVVDVPTVEQKISLFDMRKKKLVPPVVLGVGARVRDLVHALGEEDGSLVQFWQLDRRIFVNDDDLVRDVPLAQDRIQLKAAVKIPCTFRLPDSQVQLLQVPEDETIGSLINLVRTPLKLDAQTLFGLGVDEDSLLAPNIAVKTLPQPLSLFVLEVITISLTERNFESSDQIRLNLPASATTQTLKQALSGKFPQPEIADRYGLILNSEQRLDSVLNLAPFFITREDAKRSLSIRFPDSRVHEFLVDGEGITSSLIEYLSEQIPKAFRLNGPDGIIDPNFPLKDIPRTVECVAVASFAASLVRCPILARGEMFALELRPDCAISDLRKQIAERLRANENEFNLMSNGKPIDEQLHISDLQLSNANPITVHFPAARRTFSVLGADHSPGSFHQPPASFLHEETDSLPSLTHGKLAAPKSLGGLPSRPARPPNYDQLLQQLRAETGTPLKICKKIFDDHAFDYQRALDLLLAPEYDYD